MAESNTQTLPFHADSQLIYRNNTTSNVSDLLSQHTINRDYNLKNGHFIINEWTSHPISDRSPDADHIEMSQINIIQTTLGFALQRGLSYAEPLRAPKRNQPTGSIIKQTYL